MQLTIISPEKQLFVGESSQITIPTYIGEITVLPNHMPLITIIKPGLIKFLPLNMEETQTFVFDAKLAHIAVSEGIAYIDGQKVTILTNEGITLTTKDSTQLLQEETDLHAEIEILKQKGDLEEIEKALIKIETIQANIKLLKLHQQSKQS